MTRPVPFLKPGNPYRLLNTVCRGPTPHAAARVLIRHLKRAIRLLTRIPPNRLCRPPWSSGRSPFMRGWAPRSPKGEEELSGDVECLLVLEAQVRG